MAEFNNVMVFANPDLLHWQQVCSCLRNNNAGLQGVLVGFPANVGLVEVQTLADALAVNDVVTTISLVIQPGAEMNARMGQLLGQAIGNMNNLISIGVMNYNPHVPDHDDGQQQEWNNFLDPFWEGCAGCQSIRLIHAHSDSITLTMAEKFGRHRLPAEIVIMWQTHIDIEFIRALLLEEDGTPCPLKRLLLSTPTPPQVIPSEVYMGIADALANNTSLDDFSIGLGPIDLDSAKAFAEAIATNNRLTKFGISTLCDEGLNILTSAISKNLVLTTVSLNENSFQGMVQESVALEEYRKHVGVTAKMNEMGRKHLHGPGRVVVKSEYFWSKQLMSFVQEATTTASSGNDGGLPSAVNRSVVYRWLSDYPDQFLLARAAGLGSNQEEENTKEEKQQKNN